MKRIGSFLSNDFRKKKVKGFMVLFFVIVLLYGMILSAWGPNKKAQSLREQFVPEDPLPENERVFYELPDIRELNRDMAFLQARGTMAKSDSIGISINLQDSVILLEIQGVTVHKTPIHGYRKSRFFSRLDEHTAFTLFSSPLQVVSEFATIQKEPILYKKAPKDTLEARLNMFLPDTIQEHTVAFSLLLENGIRLEFCQSEKEWDINYLKYILTLKWQQASEILESMLHIRIPGYDPPLRIKVPKKDAITLYRAMPAHARVSLKP